MNFGIVSRIVLALVLVASACQRPSTTKAVINEEAFADHIRQTPFQTPEQQLKSFLLPEGFEITLFASEPQISKPMNIEFDQQGRLWVTQSSEYPYASELGKGKDKITILEDTDGDGKADKVTPFRTDLNIPIGLLPVADGVITYSIPNIFYFKYADQTLTTSTKDALLGGFGYKDTHGMINNLIRGFDGWVHACHGFSNTSRIAGRDGDSIQMVSGNTFRFTLDGSRVEQTTYGRVNPFGYAFDERGFLYSADCHSKPIYQLIPQATYPHFGNPPTGIGFGPEMMGYQLGSTAIAGLAFYTGGPFPIEYHQNFFTGDVVTSRVDRTSVRYVGSTPIAQKEADFLRSNDPWFRPVDVKIGPDGALYVADFYNKIIGHYEVALDHPERDRTSGRIWRIAYKGSKKNKSSKVPNWATATIDELLNGLSFPQLSIRMKAADQLVDVWKEKAIKPVQALLENASTSELAKVQALWILHRLDSLSDELHQQALRDTSLTVRIHAIRILGEQKQLNDVYQSVVIQSLTDDSPFIQRVAAEVATKFPKFEHIEPLLRLYQTTPQEDTHLKYTALLAIRYQLREEQVLHKALAQKWSPEVLAIVAHASLDIPSPTAAQLVFQQLQQQAIEESKLPAYYTFLGRQLSPAHLDQSIATIQRRYATTTHTQLTILTAFQKGMKESGKAASSDLEKWGKQLVQAIISQSTQLPPTDQKDQALAEAIRLAGEWQLTALKSSIQSIFEQQKAAIVKAAAAKTLIELDPSYVPLVAESFSAMETDMATKEKLVPILANHTNNSIVITSLLKGMIGTNRKLQTSTAAALASSTKGIDLLLETIDNEHLSSALLNENALKAKLEQMATTSQKARVSELLANSQLSHNERVTLIEARIKGYPSAKKELAKGQQLFQQNCASCHQIKGSGNAIGPNLDGIGNWGVTALTEKILDPNRTISTAFRTYQITLKNNTQQMGLYKRTEGKMLYFADATGQEFAVSKEQISTSEVTPYTLMPDTFRHTLSENEYYNLLHYLLSIK